MSGTLKRLLLPVLALLGLTPAFGYWNYSIIDSFLWDYAPAAGPAVYQGGSAWRLVVIEECGYRYMFEGNGIGWNEVGEMFETPDYEVFAINSDYGDFFALYGDGNEMMFFDGYDYYSTELYWDINNYHDFCPMHNRPDHFAYESGGNLYYACISGYGAEVIDSWSGCSGNVSCVYQPDIGSLIFGCFGTDYRAIQSGGDVTNYPIGTNSQAEGFVTSDGTVYVAYVNANHELHVITDTVSEEPVDEYVATSSYHPQLFADSDGPVVATDVMVYYKNSRGDWYGEQYKSEDGMGGASCIFRQNGKIFIIGGKIIDAYNWGIVSFYRDWHSDAPVVDLQGRATDDGVLLSWVEEAGLAGSRWTLERDGEGLATLSGDAEYLYLDRDLPGPGVYRYALCVTPPEGDSFRVGPVEVSVVEGAPARPVLSPPYPNPAGEGVTLEYTLPADCAGARLILYDLAGRRISVLNLEPGDHAVELDCSGYAAGVYTAVLETPGGTVTRRLVIAR